MKKDDNKALFSSRMRIAPIPACAAATRLIMQPDDGVAIRQIHACGAKYDDDHVRADASDVC